MKWLILSVLLISCATTRTPQDNGESPQITSPTNIAKYSYSTRRTLTDQIYSDPENRSTIYCACTFEDKRKIDYSVSFLSRTFSFTIKSSIAF
ncbi:MAG: hypothetical protein E2O68_05200 [Deltaproteobacteria bacterium]|nr:MAG: hypothetical protein E2O68_05200 [Deltaproteobacteria bacterium]